jgi:heme exporter protein A
MLRLQANDIGKRFGRRILFRNVAFELPGGTVTAVTGNNGSGKSTLLRILAGVLRPTRGEVTIEVDGKAIERDKQPFHVGLVAPYLNLYEAFSPAENLRFIGRARGLTSLEERISDVLSDVGLHERSNDFVSTFSSGMKQRVRIAAALFCEPRILLLDEPRSNLDSAGHALVNRVVERALDRRDIVVIATNDDDEALRSDLRIRIEDYM